MAPDHLLTITATGAALGAEVSGVDVRSMDDETFAAIHQAWLDYQVLLFRRQQLSDQDLIAFSRRFGDLDHAPIQENGRRFVEGYPEIYVVSNVVEQGVAIGSLGAGEAVWHTDMSYLAHPPKASVLYALEVPATGGDTGSARCTEPGRPCPRPCSVVSSVYGSNTTRPTTAAGTCGKASRPPTIRALRRACCIR